MDDSAVPRLIAEFPVGDTTVRVNEPNDAQKMMLALSRAPGKDDGEEMVRLIRRLFRILEKLMGQDQWDSVIEAGVADETLDEKDLVGLIEAVVRFPWHKHRSEEAVPAETPAGDELPQPPAPQPRIVSGA